MKTILPILILVLVTLKLSGAPPTSTDKPFAALHTSKIPTLEVDHLTFEEALTKIREAWKQQHPELTFPVALVGHRRLENDRNGVAARPILSMQLTNVPFIEAIRYLCDATGRHLIENPGLLRIGDIGTEIVEDWVTKSYPTSDVVLRGLGLGVNPTREELESVYAHFGLKLDEWMAISYFNGKLIVTAANRQHQQIAGINMLIENGFVITAKAEQKRADQPATRPP
jgi:hypothetical protein